MLPISWQIIAVMLAMSCQHAVKLLPTYWQISGISAELQQINATGFDN